MGVWIARANTGPDGSNLITAAELPMIEEAVYAACDAADGLEDGLLSDPRTCSFDPATLACNDGETADCLLGPQVDALRKLYAGPQDSRGQSLHPGLPYGSEVDWSQWLTGRTADVNDDLWRIVATQYMRYMGLPIDPGESYEITDFDFDTDPARLDFMMSIYGADNPDLDAFRQRGGKLLMWHGWSDASIPPWTSIAYYEAVEQRIGNRQATQDFLRLFLIPGAGHCGQREGAGVTQSGIDPLSALERWVEHDEAPDHLPTTKTDSMGQVLWTRPVCPYPQRAIYRGEGDASDSSSFECVTP
jgi:feruloyl esterase